MALSDFWLKRDPSKTCRFIGITADGRAITVEHCDPLRPDLRSLRLVGRWRRERKERSERRTRRHANR